MKQTLAEELQLLHNLYGINIKLADQFLELYQSNKFTKHNNPYTHFGSFFIPIHKESKSIYLSHHKKAKCWIPPGGHIDNDESSKETVYREFIEELNFQLIKEEINLFALSISQISNAGSLCKTHYDFWYLVDIKEMIDFGFDSREFFAAKWVNGIDAIDKINTNFKHPEQTAIIKNVLNNL